MSLKFKDMCLSVLLFFPEFLFELRESFIVELDGVRSVYWLEADHYLTLHGVWVLMTVTLWLKGASKSLR